MVMEDEELRHVSGEPQTKALRFAGLWWESRDKDIAVWRRKKKKGGEMPLKKQQFYKQSNIFS